jgi:RNA polymerase sigma-70 factor (ECF subfamily)
VNLGPRAALDELDELEPTLTGATARQAVAVRADLLRRLGRIQEARDAYIRARSHERNGPVRDYFGRRVDELGG